MSKTAKPIAPTLKWDEAHPVRYCVETWVRDEQIKRAIARPVGRIERGQEEARPEPIAVVCFGPSLTETWETVKDFPYVMSCSGSHKFLLEHGVVPTWHVEVDPRSHKVQLIGPPHPAVEYCIASACHPAVFDHLTGMNVKLWHVFNCEEEGYRTLPPGEWAITGGPDVGLRAMTMARFFGFTDIHVFGMDGCFGASGTHASEHPNKRPSQEVEYQGKTYQTTIAMLECAKSVWHELNQMPDVKATFHGDGLVQAMAKDYVPDYPTKGPGVINAIAARKPELISSEYRDLNAQLHEQNIAYGVGGGKHADTVLKLAEQLQTHSILDYGCGKGYLAKALKRPIWEYDPAIPGKDESPRPADLVVCTDVLEHVEMDRLNFVLDDLRRVTRAVGYLVIHTGPAQKTLPDGRNTHLIQKNGSWWKARLSEFFTVGKLIEKGPELHIVVGPKAGKKKAKAA